MKDRVSVWSRRMAWLGGLLWAALFAVRPVGVYSSEMIERLVLFSILVCGPLVLGLAAQGDRQGRLSLPFRLVQAVYPVAALLATVAMFLPAGWTAGLLTLAWMFCTVLIGWAGVVRFLPRGAAAIEEACIDAGLLYVPIGGAWLLSHRLGIDPFHYGETVVLLTAIHFHYSGFLAPVIIGMAGRQVHARKPQWGRMHRWLALGAILSPIFVGIGISAGTALELFAVTVFVVTLMLFAALTLFVLLGTVGQATGKGLLAISSGSVVLTMLFAFLYGLGRHAGEEIIGIPQMVLAHGMLNAFGFAFCGLLAWTRIAPQARVMPPGIPFSRLQSGGRVGADFFERIGAVAEAKQAPTGLVDDLREFAGLEHVHADIRDFYERTGEYELRVEPQWQRGFRRAARVFKRFSARMEQLNFPVEEIVREDRMDSRILPIRDEIDGRTKVRAWVRTYLQTGLPIYVAAYSTHVTEGERYMNIAFPMPGGNMTSILHLEAADGDGVLLTTKKRGSRFGDQGVYFATRWLPIRLPINESIHVWPSKDPQVQLVAKHDMWLFGIKCLTLDYYIARKK